MAKSKRSLLNRYRALLRDNLTCRDCGFTNLEGKGLEVHHGEPLSQGGSDDIENLITLCHDCHNKRHGKSGNCGQAGETKIFTCEQCNSEFIPYRPEYQRYCSARCRFRAYDQRNPRLSKAKAKGIIQ